MTEREFQAVFESHREAVYRFAWRMAGPEAAEDIAQDVFLALLRHPNRFDPARGTLRAFLLGIARNLALKQHRRERPWQPLETDDVEAPAFDFGREEVGEIVGRAVRALSPLQREALILAEYESLSLEDIAQATGADVGTIKSRLYRARQNLKRMLAPLRPSHLR